MGSADPKVYLSNLKACSIDVLLVVSAILVDWYALSTADTEATLCWFINSASVSGFLVAVAARV